MPKAKAGRASRSEPEKEKKKIKNRLTEQFEKRWLLPSFSLFLDTLQIQ
jgi:hypothetical protein